jgi:hypothetical protein
MLDASTLTRPMSERAPDASWDPRSNDAADAETDRISSLGPEELRRELVALGVDLEAISEQACAVRLRIDPRALPDERAAMSHSWRVAIRVATVVAAVVACVVVAALVRQ